MKGVNLFSLLIIGISIESALTHTILFLSLPYYGHINPMVSLAHELSKNGHTSHVMIADKFKDNLKLGKGVHHLKVEEYPEIAQFDKLAQKLFTLHPDASWRETQKVFHQICDRYLFDKELFERIKSVNASLAVIDEVFPGNFLSVFPYRLGIPFVLMGAQNQVNLHRTPWAINVFPHKTLVNSDRMSFLRRLSNALLMLTEYILPALGTPGRNIKEYAPELTDINFEKLLRKAELYIIDYDVFLDYPRSALPNVKYIGGIATKPAERLQGDLLEFVNTSKHGIIVVSHGTLVHWKADHLKKMEEAFSKIKYDVVWKHSNSSYSHPNVLLTKWLPQNDLLGHPKTKLFITHCGNSGQYESLYHAVPMIGFPVFADQPFNGYRMQVKGYGISMDMNNYSVDELIKNIEEVIENPKYKKSIAKASKMFRSQKERPAERAARHIDEIIKYGGSHLRSACQDIPLYQFLLLDVWTVLLSATFVILYLIIFILRKCFSYICQRKKTKID